MNTHQLALAAGALGAVLLLAVGLARLLKAFGGRMPAMLAPNGPDRALRLVETLPLGGGRRLHRVEVDGRALLVLTGGGQDVLLPWLGEGSGA